MGSRLEPESCNYLDSANYSRKYHTHVLAILMSARGVDVSTQKRTPRRGITESKFFGPTPGRR